MYINMDRCDIPIDPAASIKVFFTLLVEFTDGQLTYTL